MVVSPFFVFEQIPEGTSPRRHAPGRGVNQENWGRPPFILHVQHAAGEPILPVDAASARAWQGSDDA
jgi:hypothetical protein